MNICEKIVHFEFFKINKYKLTATEGPIPNAKIRVPTPTIPPKDHPAKTTIISIQALTKAIGALVFFWSPVINPSLGPAPKLAIKYTDVPKPIINIPTATIKS